MIRRYVSQSVVPQLVLNCGLCPINDTSSLPEPSSDTKLSTQFKCLNFNIEQM